MKRGLIRTAVLLLATLLQSASALAADIRPNILYIVADDLGWKDVGFHGSDIKTPNIDALAAAGAKLEQFYAQPMCTPTRAALMTGRYPLRYGLQTAVIPQGHTYGLPTDEWLLPQALKEAGYETAIIGKWHLGHADRKYWPRQRGFDYQYGPLIGEIDYFTHKRTAWSTGIATTSRSKEKGYSTTLLGNDAVKLIERARSGDAALSLPRLQRRRTRPTRRRRNISTDTRTSPIRAAAPTRPASPRWTTRSAASLPRSSRREMRDNTLIVFQSDNGGTRNAMFAGRTTCRRSRSPATTAPIATARARSTKAARASWRFANWPGHIKAGSTVDEMIHVVDMYPTLRRPRRRQLGKSKPLDGVDVWPTISEGKPSPRTEVVYNIEPFRAAHPPGRLEADLAHAAAAVGRALQPRGGPVREEQSGAGSIRRRWPRCRSAPTSWRQRPKKPILLQTEFKNMIERMHLSPALPADLESLDAER